MRKIIDSTRLGARARCRARSARGRCPLQGRSRWRASARGRALRASRLHGLPSPRWRPLCIRREGRPPPKSTISHGLVARLEKALGLKKGRPLPCQPHSLISGLAVAFHLRPPSIIRWRDDRLRPPPTIVTATPLTIETFSGSPRRTMAACLYCRNGVDVGRGFTLNDNAPVHSFSIGIRRPNSDFF